MTQSQIMEVHNRKGVTWPAISTIAATALLLGCTAGCVQWQHCLREHCLSFGPERHEVNYRQCSHCGKIIPGDGFNCPNCKQVPVYHGYEPTCWRNFPDGWGCPPEHVGQQGMHQEGLLESESIHDVDVTPEPTPAETLSPPSESDIKSSGDLGTAEPQPASIEGPIIDTTNADANDDPEPLELDDFTVKAEQQDADQDPAMAYAITSPHPTPAAQPDVPAAAPGNDAVAVGEDAAAAGEDTVADSDAATSPKLAPVEEAAVKATVRNDRQVAAEKVALESVPTTKRPSADTSPTEMEPAADTTVAAAQPQLVESAPLPEQAESTVQEVVESSPQPTIVQPAPRIITAMPAEVQVATAPKESKPTEQSAESKPIKRDSIQHDSIEHDSIVPARKSSDVSAEQKTAKVMLTPPPIMVQKQPTPAEPVALAPIKRLPVKTASTPGASSQQPPIESRQAKSNDRVEEDATTRALSDAEPVFEVVKRIPLPIGTQLKTLETIDEDPAPAAKPKKTVESLDTHSQASEPQGGLSAVMAADRREQVKRQVLAKPEAYLAKAPVVRLDSSASVASTEVQLGGASLQKVRPRDEHGNIPIRKVRLQIDDDEDASVHSFSDQYPQPVHRIAPASTPKPMPRPRTDTLIKKDNSENYPLPVRRIQLTGLTVTK